MKNIGFLKACSGISMVIAATALLIFSVKFNPAQADAPATTAETGKIMMHQNSFLHNGGFYWHILVWNTETGKSKMYNYEGSNASLKKAPYQLPSSPLY